VSDTGILSFLGTFDVLEIFTKLHNLLRFYDDVLPLCMFSALYISVLLMFFVYILASAVGLVIYAYYQQQGCDPIRAEYITTPNQVRMDIKQVCKVIWRKIASPTVTYDV